MLQILALLASFALGAVVHALWRPESSGELVRGSEQGLPKSGSDRTSQQVLSGQSSKAPDRKPAASTERKRALTLQPEVIDALLSGGGLQRQLSRMGFSPDEMKEVEAIREEGIARLKTLEVRHSRPISDAKGEYVEIDAFPKERQQWLSHIEASLRQLVQDDRASIVARIISFSDSDQDVGLYRRELFVKQPESPGGRLQIEERTFNADGNLIDSDYELVDRNSHSRWGHLLELSPEK